VLLLVAAAAADVWPALGDALSIHAVERIAVVALVVILLDGGMDIGWARMRSAAGPVLSLGVLGTFATAGLLALAAHWILGFGWTLAGVAGAALAPTDPAVVFSVLGGRAIEGRSGTTLEGEAGVNDPAGIALMLGMIELATHADASWLGVLAKFALQLGLGLAFGFAAGRLASGPLRRARRGGEALALVLAAAVYAATALCGGSGFLAVFVAGLVLGDTEAPRRLHGRLASVSEAVVFVALGLTVALGELSARTWGEGALLVLFLAFVARPLTVLATLAGSRLSRPERIFIAWAGLKGAVPILLAAFAVTGGVAGADTIYGLVFVVVLFSVIAQGTLVPTVARRLAILLKPT
jgi:cell volume regulation protein A